MGNLFQKDNENKEEEETKFKEPQISPEKENNIKIIKEPKELTKKNGKINQENIIINNNSIINKEENELIKVEEREISEEQENKNNYIEKSPNEKNNDSMTHEIEENSNIKPKIKKLPLFQSYEPYQEEKKISLTERDHHNDNLIYLKLNTERNKPQILTSNRFNKKEPKDSNPKIHILSERKNGIKNIKKINPLNLSTHLKNSKFVDIPRTEYNTTREVPPLVWGRGMATGEYKFLGQKNIIKENFSLDDRIMFTEEEINNELTERKKRYNKAKKYRYEIIDKFYTLTDIKGKMVKKFEKIETFSSNNNSINNYDNLMYKSMETINLSKPLDNYSCYIFSQINKLRTEPQSFIGIISDAKANISKDRFGRIIYNTTNSKIKVALNSGEKAFNEAINFLKKMKPMNPLQYNKMISIIPPRNEGEILDKNDLNNKVEEIMKFNDIICIKSFWRDVIKDPEISFLLMIIDDNGINKGMRRKDILNPEIKYIGISSCEIKGKFVCYITLGY